MIDPRYSRKFVHAPTSLRGLVAMVLEPAITVTVYLGVLVLHGRQASRADWVLCFLAVALTWPGVNRFGQRLSNSAVGIMGNWLGMLAVLLGFGWLIGSLGAFDRRELLMWAAATPLLQLAAVRAGNRVLRHSALQARNRRTGVVIGAGPLGVKVARAVGGSPTTGVDILGVFDDRAADRVPLPDGLRTLGALRQAAAYIRGQGVKEVYITLPLGSQPRIVELLQDLQSTTASIHYVPDVFGISIIQGRLQEVDGMPMVGLTETPFTGTNRLIKRLSDIVLASVILVLIAPLLAAVALGVRLSSPGPVIFRQRRNGLHGEEITVYKFRSMRTLDNGPEVRQATRGDPRITRFGAFIRRTSLDELPQFVNVLQGRMSIVGPRPHAVAHNELYRELVQAYMVRHKVKPGITGWAQVQGLRGETDTLEKMQARVEADLEYLRNWSVGLDLVIILRTIRTVFVGQNAV